MTGSSIWVLRPRQSRHRNPERTGAGRQTDFRQFGGRLHNRGQQLGGAHAVGLARIARAGFLAVPELRAGCGGGRPPRPASTRRKHCRRISWQRSCWRAVFVPAVLLAAGTLPADFMAAVFAPTGRISRLSLRRCGREWGSAPRTDGSSSSLIAESWQVWPELRRAEPTRHAQPLRVQYFQQARNLVFSSLDLAKDLKRSGR